MKLEQMNQENETYWWSVYDAAFPPHETLPFDLMKKMVKRSEDVHMAVIMDDTQQVGVTLYVTLPDEQVFVLFLAIDPTLQGNGLGSRVLELLKTTYPGGVMLECEELGLNSDNETQRERRYAFYQRNGLMDSGYITDNPAGTFHLMRSNAKMTTIRLKDAISLLGLETKVY